MSTTNIDSMVICIAELCVIVRKYAGTYDPAVPGALARAGEQLAALRAMRSEPDPAQIDLYAGNASLLQADFSKLEDRVMAFLPELGMGYGSDFTVVPCAPTPGGFEVIRRALDEASPITPTEQSIRVVIDISGGVFQSGATNDPRVELLLLDYDDEGMEPEDLTDIPQRDGSTEEAYVISAQLELDPAFVAGAFAAEEAHLAARGHA